MKPWCLAENLSIQGVSRVPGAVQRIRSRALRAGRGDSGSGGRQFRIRLDFPRHYHTKLRDSPQANVQSASHIFGQTAARQTLQSRNSAQRLFSMQHLKVVGALATFSTSGTSPFSVQRKWDAPECTGSAFMRRFGVRFVCVPGRFIGFDRVVFQRPVFLIIRGIRRFGFAAARRAWKAVDNPFRHCFRVWCSGPGLITLPTVSAVGGRSWIVHIPTAPSGRGEGRYCFAKALRSFRRRF